MVPWRLGLHLVAVLEAVVRKMATREDVADQFIVRNQVPSRGLPRTKPAVPMARLGPARK
jgi:hypothetical protein